MYKEYAGFPMSLLEITEIANAYTDENFEEEDILKFVNTGISRVNVSIKANLPQFNINEYDYYPYLDADWMNVVVIPFVCWSIKMNDGSLNEAREFQTQFRLGLEELQKNKKSAIPEKWQGTGFTNEYQVNAYDKMRHQGQFRNTPDAYKSWILDKPIQDMPLKDDED